MKRILPLIVIAVITLLTGCRQGDPIAARNAVMKEYPDGDIADLPGYGTNYKYIVRDTNGAVWYVDCLNYKDDNISGKTMIFPAKR
jgi:hypothetical protein